MKKLGPEICVYETVYEYGKALPARTHTPTHTLESLRHANPAGGGCEVPPDQSGSVKCIRRSVATKWSGYVWPPRSGHLPVTLNRHP
jgi:hypothetical protein